MSIEKTAEAAETGIDPEGPDLGAAGAGIAVLLIGALVAGSIIGLLSPQVGETLSSAIDPTILLMVSLLLFEVRLGNLTRVYPNLRFLALAWCANFLFVPLIGFTIASLFLSGQPLLLTGLVIYFFSPCTDWFLGFTRMARGDTALGAVLLPINMVTQLLLYPVWLWFLTWQSRLVVDFNIVWTTLVDWFLIPFLLAQIGRAVLYRVLPPRMFRWLLNLVGYAVPIVIATLILEIFAANIAENIGDMANHLVAFCMIPVAVFLFFVSTFLMGEGLSRLARLGPRQHVLLTMTTAARNAPLMLAVTAIAIPDQPLILAALVTGMLVEFPHLTALRHLMLWQQSRQKKLPS